MNRISRIWLDSLHRLRSRKWWNFWSHWRMKLTGIYFMVRFRKPWNGKKLNRKRVVKVYVVASKNGKQIGSSSFLICKIGSRWLTLDWQKSCQPCGFADIGTVFESSLRYMRYCADKAKMLACAVLVCSPYQSLYFGSTWLISAHFQKFMALEIASLFFALLSLL